GLDGGAPARVPAAGFRAAALVLDPRDRLRGGPGRSDRRVPAQNLGDDGAAVAGGRPALRARLVTVDRCRGGVLRPDLAGGQTAPAQAVARCLRGSAAREGPSWRRPDVGGRRSADGEIAARLNGPRGGATRLGR